MALKYTSEQPWQMSCSGLKERGESLLASAQWMDCTFVVGAGERISAHRLVLSSASPVFAAMLYGPLTGDRDDDIAVPDIESEAFKLLLQYVYTNDVDITSCRIACDLYYAAQKYMLLGLVAACSSYLTCRLDPQTACRAYELALCMQNTELMDRSIREIKVRTKDVLTAPSFIDAHIDTVSSIFEMETLNIDSEMELVEAAERYARSQYENSQQSLPEDQNEDSESPATLKNRPLIQQIRFLTLTAEELEKYASWTSLLNEAEISALAANIGSQDAQEKIPCDFSSIRTSRKKPSTEESVDPNTFRVRIENINDIYTKMQRADFYGGIVLSEATLHGLKWSLHAFEDPSGPFVMLECSHEGINKPTKRAELRVLRNGAEPMCWTEGHQLTPFFTAKWKWFSEPVWEELLDPQNGFVSEDGALTFEVFVEKDCNKDKIVEETCMTTSYPSSEKCLDPNTFRVRIENVRELHHFGSQRHKLHGLKWKLEAVEGKIGPYLVLKSGLSDISRPVQGVEMRVLRRGFEPLRLTESDGLRTDFSAAWEWFSVIEWDDLLNPDNGYLDHDAITVEVYAEKSCNISNFVMK